MMEIRYYSLEHAHHALGVAVVVDVLRAFTTAAYAFAAGAARIYPVAGINEAYHLQKQLMNAIIIGEDGGIKPEKFDYGNSPAEISSLKLAGVPVVQRTSAGTQGIARSVNAACRLGASFVVAKSTATYIKRLDPEVISFIITGESYGRDGDEDRACAEYIEALIRDHCPEPDQYTQRVMTSSVGRAFLAEPNFYLQEADISLSLKVDAFPFFLPVREDNGLLIMEPCIPEKD